MNNDIKYKVIALLRTLSVCIENSAETQFTIRCPYCGDSMNQNHAHFSIHIDVNSNDPMVYNCLKCPASGLLTTSVLEDLGLELSQDIYTGLKTFNKKIPHTNRFIQNQIENFKVPCYQENNLNDKKLNYLNERLGTNITYQDAQGLKILLNLFDFIKYNDIKTIPNKKFRYLQFLNDNYIGFLSTNNNCITMRKVTDVEFGMRYDKIILNPTNYNPCSFYSIPNSIDLMYTDDINIHIAEGTFDILSVYYNLMHQDKKNNFYYAACGFGLMSPIEYLIYNGINTGLNIHIYSDSDKADQDHIQNLYKKKSMTVWLDHYYIHRNVILETGKKDYGVPSNRIIDSKKKIF